jgi:hypothetical protein
VDRVGILPESLSTSLLSVDSVSPWECVLFPLYLYLVKAILSHIRICLAMWHACVSALKSRGCCDCQDARHSGDLAADRPPRSPPPPTIDLAALAAAESRVYGAVALCMFEHWAVFK